MLLNRWSYDVKGLLQHGVLVWKRNLRKWWTRIRLKYISCISLEILFLLPNILIRYSGILKYNKNLNFQFCFILSKCRIVTFHTSYLPHSFPKRQAMVKEPLLVRMSNWTHNNKHICIRKAIKSVFLLDILQKGPQSPPPPSFWTSLR